MYTRRWTVHFVRPYRQTRWDPMLQQMLRVLWGQPVEAEFCAAEPGREAVNGVEGQGRQVLVLPSGATDTGRVIFFSSWRSCAKANALSVWLFHPPRQGLS